MKRFTVRSIAAHLLAAGVLSACTVAVVDTPRPLPPTRACTLEHAPVCGQRGDRLRTFSNACLARADGFRVVARGACRRPVTQPPRQSACTREFAPVCAVRGNRWRTFSNACMARVDGFRIVHRGRCR